MSAEPTLTPLTVHLDDRGSLFEAFHFYDLSIIDGLSPKDPSPHWTGQIYMVHSPARGTIRGLHRHKELWDWFICVTGRAKVVVVLGEDLKRWEFILDAAQPSRLEIPPAHWHGWVSLVDDTRLLCIGSETYQKEFPDEERIAWGRFGEEIWKIKPR